LPEVIFDSSFLMAVVEGPTAWREDMTELIGRVDPLILDCVETELRRIGSGDGRKAKVAKVALEIASGFGREKCGEGTPDDEVVSVALKKSAAVATTDAGLAKTLRSVHVKVIGLKSGRASLL
jgi:rRNA-processing protein FCF1